MGETTGITWTDHTFNPWIGCTKVSQGCAHCYAETQNHCYNWTAGWGPGAPRKRTSVANWLKPLVWARKAAKSGEYRRVFCASLADVFDAEVPGVWRDDLWQLIQECSGQSVMGGLEWLLLTKRPENINAMLPNEWLESPPDFIRIGVTAENQEMFAERWGHLCQAWGGLNFISYEPALGPLDISYAWKQIDWIICGGESGPGCRPMELLWARDLRDQCHRAGIPFFFKQIGGHPNKQHDPAGWPVELRVQEFPAVGW